MPKLLVWRKQSSTALYHKGDVISVADDGHEFSSSEVADDHTTVIEVVGVTLAKCRQLLEKERRPAVLGDPEYDSPDAEDKWIYTGKNKWFFTSIADHTITPEEMDAALTNREGPNVFSSTVADTYG
jgi:hypothetical protein